MIERQSERSSDREAEERCRAGPFDSSRCVRLQESLSPWTFAGLGVVFFGFVIYQKLVAANADSLSHTYCSSFGYKRRHSECVLLAVITATVLRYACCHCAYYSL